MKKKRVWVVVLIWRGLLDDIRIAYTERGADMIFTRLTGIKAGDYFSPVEGVREEVDPSDDWGGSDIWEKRV